MEIKRKDKVIKGLECCVEGTCPSVFSKAYRDCPYTMGLYCRMDKLHKDALYVIKELDEIVHCGECVYYSGQFCNKRDVYPWPNDNWFCGDGKRK